jgi:hypothetical protein
MSRRVPSEEHRELRLVPPLEIADRADSMTTQLLGGGEADAPERLHRQRPEELSLAFGLDDEQAVGLGRPAGHLG